MSKTKVYTMTEYLELGLDTGDYGFSSLQGKFKATLDLKVMMKNNRLMLNFFTLENGEKIVCTTPAFKGYLGMSYMDIGSILTLTLERRSDDRAYLVRVEE